MPTYTNNLNTGLSHKFTLKDGKFLLTGGTEKADSNLSFMLHFIGWFRTYYNDFVPDILWLLQKPTSIIDSAKNIILARFLRAASKYLTFINIEKIDLSNTAQNRKHYRFVFQYTYKLDTPKKVKAVKFVTAAQ